MNKRIEWIEPEEVTRERCEQRRRALPAFGLFICGVAALLLPAEALLAAAIGSDFFPFAAGTFGGVFGIAQVAWLSLDASSSTCALSQEAAYSNLKRIGIKYLWKDVRSFELADHPTLPGIRSLTIHHQRAPHKLQLNFREGELDEAELSTFVEAQIAHARTERLMRRIKM